VKERSLIFREEYTDTVPACDRRTDGQTDMQTDGHMATAYAALA